MQETRVGYLGWEDPLEEEMATHSSILGWENPWTKEPEIFILAGQKLILLFHKTLQVFTFNSYN